MTQTLKDFYLLNDPMVPLTSPEQQKLAVVRDDWCYPHTVLRSLVEPTPKESIG